MAMDYYRVLFITKDSTDEEVKQAYKKMSLLHHPKRQKVDRPLTPTNCLREQMIREEERKLNSIQMFYIVSEAYDVLGNPLYRAIYDSFGMKGLKEGIPSPAGFIPPYAYHGDANLTFREFFGTDNPFADLLASSCVPIDFFAGTENAGFKAKQPSIFREVWLSLEELYVGCLKKVMICKTLLSSDGNSTYETTKILSFQIAPGTAAGSQYVFPNEGDEGPNIQPADIIFLVREKKHPVYIREGDNIIYNTTVTLCQALTGITMPILQLDGRRFNINVVHIITPGYEKIIQNEGFPVFNEPSKRGNMIIRFNVHYPHTLTQSQKKLTKEALDCGLTEDDLLKVKPSALPIKENTCYSKRQPVTLVRSSGCYCPPPEDTAGGETSDGGSLKPGSKAGGTDKGSKSKKKDKKKQKVAIGSSGAVTETTEDGDRGAAGNPVAVQ